MFSITEEVYAQTQLGADVLIPGSVHTVRAKVVPGISDVLITNSGLGYTPGDIVEIKSDTGSNAKVRVKEVSSGPVDTLIKESSGDGYVIEETTTESGRFVVGTRYKISQVII